MQAAAHFCGKNQQYQWKTSVMLLDAQREGTPTHADLSHR
jgi:hypothetical protein